MKRRFKNNDPLKIYSADNKFSTRQQTEMCFKKLAHQKRSFVFASLYARIYIKVCTYSALSIKC